MRKTIRFSKKATQRQKEKGAGEKKGKQTYLVSKEHPERSDNLNSRERKNRRTRKEG